METINKKKVFRKENIPNILLVSRIVMTVAIVVLILLDCYAVESRPMYELLDIFVKYHNGDYVPYCTINAIMFSAGVLFVVASFTDFLDGFLARKYNWVSDFGKFWDPVADKILINSTMICLTWHSIIPAFIPILMIARDVAVDANRNVAAKKNIVVAANFFGKLKTVLQMVSLILIFFIFQGTDFVHHPGLWWGVQNALVYCACIVSIISGVIYFIEIKKATKAQEQNASIQQ